MARAEQSATGFLLKLTSIQRLPQSDGGPHVRTPQTLPHASSLARRRPSLCETFRSAGARERAGRRRAAIARARRPSTPRIGFAPETIAPSAICRAKIVRHASVAGWLRLAMRGKASDDDRIFDIAGAVRPDRDCGLGGARVSGNIATFASAFPTNKAHYPLCQAKP